MPANIIEINGEIKYTLGDSFTEPLVMFLERYCYENMPEEAEEAEGYYDRDTIFARFMIAWSKAHYGKDFDFDTCVIKKDIEPDLHTVRWTKYGDKIIYVAEAEEEKQKSDQGQV